MQYRFHCVSLLNTGSTQLKNYYCLLAASKTSLMNLSDPPPVNFFVAANYWSGPTFSNHSNTRKLEFTRLTCFLI